MDAIIEKLLARLSSLAEVMSKCSKDTEKPADVPGIHLPYLVCLLESVGYQIRKMECNDPKNMLRKQSTTVIVSCGRSGQRCFMDMTVEEDDCNCLSKGPEKSDFFLEAFSNGKTEERWLEKSSSQCSQHCIPVISNELKSSSATVLHELVELMKENFREINHGRDQITQVIDENCDLSTSSKDIPEIITIEISTSDEEALQTMRQDVIEQSPCGENSEIEEKSEEVVKRSTDDSPVFGKTYIVDQASSKTTGLNTMSSPLRRSNSYSGKRSMIPKKQITSSTSTSSLKTFTSIDNLKVDQISADTTRKSTDSSLRRSYSDSGRQALYPKQTISSTLRKCSSNSKIGVVITTSKSITNSKSTPNLVKGKAVQGNNKIPSKTSKLLQSARNIISNTKNQKLDTNVKSPKAEQIRISPGKSTLQKANTSIPNSALARPDKTSMVKKISSRVGTAILPKQSKVAKSDIPKKS